MMEKELREKLRGLQLRLHTQDVFMIDWGRFGKQPTTETLKDYPTKLAIWT